MLKIDVEKNEWEALEAMLVDGSLCNVKQFAFEYHTEEVYSKMSFPDDYFYYWLLLHGLDKLGFKIWAFEPCDPCYSAYISHSGKPRHCCANLNFVNVKYLAA